MQEHIVLNNHMTKALPCINTQQKAAKTISKNHQTLINSKYITIEVTAETEVEESKKDSSALLQS